MRQPKILQRVAQIPRAKYHFLSVAQTTCAAPTRINKVYLIAFSHLAAQPGPSKDDGNGARRVIGLDREEASKGILSFERTFGHPLAQWAN